ncbi:MAG TPA: DUF4124 domain-containing protein [Burkholderiales bacterium]|nr:DUF4124 domain-containing protein [Burkholderiales bacterium]
MKASRGLLLAVLLCAAGASQAQIYRWVDQNGRVQYSNGKPPEGVQATVVDPDAKAGPPAADSAECHTVRCQGEALEARQRQRDAEEAELAAERAASAPKPAHGLDFRNYVRIQRGMSEGELLGIAGTPDFVSDQGFAGPDVQRKIAWTYLPTPGDPFTTTITLIGGRVSDLDRQRKF